MNAVNAVSAGPWVLEVAAPDGKCFSVNDDHRAHHFKVAHHRKAVRTQAAILARVAKIPPLGRCRIEADVYTRQPNRADPANYAGGSTVKAAVDGLVDAGIVPDDNWHYVDLRMPRMRPQGKTAARVVLTIYPWPEAIAGAAAVAAVLAELPGGEATT